MWAGVSPVPVQMWAGVSPVPVQMRAGVSPVPAPMRAGVGPVPAQTWAGVGPVPAQMWRRRAYDDGHRNLRAGCRGSNLRRPALSPRRSVAPNPFRDCESRLCMTRAAAPTRGATIWRSDDRVASHRIASAPFTCGVCGRACAMKPSWSWGSSSDARSSPSASSVGLAPVRQRWAAIAGADRTHPMQACVPRASGRHSTGPAAPSDRSPTTSTTASLPARQRHHWPA